MEINEITAAILDASYELHRAVGPGLKEIFYERVLEQILIREGHEVQRQLPISFTYQEMQFDEMFTLDLLVDRLVVVELKAVDRLLEAHRSQLLTYLRILDKPLGLLINFGSALLKDGVVRVANFRASSANLLPAGTANP